SLPRLADAGQGDIDTGAVAIGGQLVLPSAAGTTPQIRVERLDRHGAGGLVPGIALALPAHLVPLGDLGPVVPVAVELERVVADVRPVLGSPRAEVCDDGQRRIRCEGCRDGEMYLGHRSPSSSGLIWV